MKLLAFTIVLDGMPWIPLHLPMLNRVSADWEWHIIEGVARPVNCTSWCRPLMPRLSKDGTSQYIDSIAGHPRVRIHRKDEWQGKIEMVNRAASMVQEPDTILFEIDADEVWESWQVDSIVGLFSDDRSRNTAFFRCRYFVGQNVVTSGRNCFGDNPYEWNRVWKVNPGCRFSRHEPPSIVGLKPIPFTKDETESAGLVFDHYAYATEAQVQFKEYFYGYSGATSQWRRLQNNTRWPARLRSFLPWVKDDCLAMPVHRTPNPKRT